MRTTIAFGILLATAGTAGAACLSDGSNVSIKGTVVEFHSRDNQTSYMLRTPTPYCISDSELMQVQNRKPTKELLLQGDGLHRYAGRTVTVSGMIGGSGAGIPILTGNAVTP